jgi:hypothetical protein
MSTQQPLRRSRRLATIIPVSDWIAIGYNEDDARLMVKLQNDIKTICDVDSDKTEINLRVRPGTITPHHDMLIPHWQKLFKALRGRTSVTNVDIQRIHLPLSVLDLLFPCLETIPLKKLGLNATGMGDGYMSTVGLQRFISYFKQNSTLHQLRIDGYTIDNLSVASTFSEALKDHPTLKVLILDSGRLEGNPEFLEKILEGCTRLDRLALMDNLGSAAVAVLSDFIRGNNPIEFIFLNGNKISDSDTLLLASALKDNTNLHQLDLRDNGITEAGEKTLLKATYDPTSMDSIIESNHRCVPIKCIIDQTWNHFSFSEREVLKINYARISIQQKIRRKVVLALCGVDGSLFDLSHFNDLPLQLMPRVLESIQKHTRVRTKAIKNTNMPNQLEKDALTRLFHTLRGWELPLLFENLRSPSKTTGKRKRMKTRR